MKMLFASIMLFTILSLVNCANPTSPKIEKSSIVLCFDDYSVTWLDISSKYSYQKAVFNFFISGDIKNEEIIKTLIDDGHNIGNHTKGHINLKEIPSVEREEVLDYEIIHQSEKIDNLGADVSSFAYPFGAYDEDWNNRLDSSFLKIRKFWTYNNEPVFYDIENYNSTKIIDSSSLDNVYFEEDYDFYEYVDNIIYNLSSGGIVCVITSHSISNDIWGITQSRLDYLIGKAFENNIQFRLM